MPYIHPEDRDALRPASYVKARNPGELSFQIACLVDYYITKHGVNYETLNAVVGVLACAQQETYRRIVVPYEGVKISTNGDVFTVVPERDTSTEGNLS